MGDLTVSCMSTGASDWQPLFTVSGSQGDSWRQAEVVLPMDCESVQLKGHTGPSRLQVLQFLDHLA